MKVPSTNIMLLTRRMKRERTDMMTLNWVMLFMKHGYQAAFISSRSLCVEGIGVVLTTDSKPTAHAPADNSHNRTICCSDHC